MTLLFGLPREGALFGLFRRWLVDELLGGLLPGLFKGLPVDELLGGLLPGLFKGLPVDELLGGLLPDESFDNLLVPRPGAGQTSGCTELGNISSEILLIDAEYFPIDSLGVSTSISK